MPTFATRATRGLAPLLLALGAVGAYAGSIAGCGSSDDEDGAGPGGPGTCTDPTNCPPGEGGPGNVTPEPVPVTTHPRLFFGKDDVPRLRSWAVDSNPIWKSGLATFAQSARQAMDAGKVVAEDEGGPYGYSSYPAESYAMLFAFLSLVGPDEATRQADAKRAHTLLMHVIDKAALGAAENTPYRDDTFSTGNRSRWWGEGFGLTVDWIYPSLSGDDKAKIRKVFLRWSEENENASITTDNHPEPKGVYNDPKLTENRGRVWWAGNNYYAAHMRNLTLMSIALDDADDPGLELRKVLKSVTGRWLYVTDALLRGDLRGGLAAEGFEYGPQTTGYIAQTLLALHTAGVDSTSNGQQTKVPGNPYWDNAVNAFLHSVAPTSFVSTDPNYTYLGPLYQVAWYGDGEKSGFAPDYIGLFGTMGAYDQLTKQSPERLAKMRWIAENVAPGGAKSLAFRASKSDFLIDLVLYFMLFDPAAPAAADPRPSVPTSHIDPGLGRMFARTDWGPTASWFTYALGWSHIDHQHSDGNSFALYRKGEWLTKERSGYGNNIACSDYKNSLALENDAPDHNAPGEYTGIAWARGSQWKHTNDGPGNIIAHTLAPKYVYALGDATTLYSSTYEKMTDVTHASRSIVWLAPDRIVIYDRAASKTANRFKRFWLNLPAQGTVAGKTMTMQSGKGQRLFVSSLLPAASTMSVEAAEALPAEPGVLEPMKYRLRVEASGGPTNVRFLHVLQAADGGVAADATSRVTSSAGTAYEGAAVNGVVVMFPVSITPPFASVTYTVPGGTVAQLVTGLTPGAGYAVAQNGATVTVTPGGGTNADSGGVLVIGALP